MTAPGFNVAHLERIYNAAVVQAQRAQIRELGGALDGDAVLDLGCGPGHLTAELAEDVGPRGRVIGLDREPGMLIAARARMSTGTSQLLLADVTAVPVGDGQIDRAVAVQVLEYVADVDRALAEVR